MSFGVFYFSIFHEATVTPHSIDDFNKLQEAIVRVESKLSEVALPGASKSESEELRRAAKEKHELSEELERVREVLRQVTEEKGGPTIVPPSASAPQSDGTKAAKWEEAKRQCQQDFSVRFVDGLENVDSKLEVKTRDGEEVFGKDYRLKLDPEKFRNRWLVFMGDSTIRQMFGMFFRALNLELPSGDVEETDYSQLKTYFRRQCEPQELTDRYATTSRVPDYDFLNEVVCSFTDSTLNLTITAVWKGFAFRHDDLRYTQLDELRRIAGGKVGEPDLYFVSSGVHDCYYLPGEMRHTDDDQQSDMSHHILTNGSTRFAHSNHFYDLQTFNMVKNTRRMYPMIWIDAQESCDCPGEYVPCIREYNKAVMSEIDNAIKFPRSKFTIAEERHAWWHETGSTVHYREQEGILPVIVHYAAQVMECSFRIMDSA